MIKLAEKMYKHSKLNISIEEYTTALFFGINLSIIFGLEILIGLYFDILLFPIVYFPLSLYLRKYIKCYHSKSMIGCFFITVVEYLIGLCICMCCIHIFSIFNIHLITELISSILSTIITASSYGGFSKLWMKS